MKTADAGVVEDDVAVWMPSHQDRHILILLPDLSSRPAQKDVFQRASVSQDRENWNLDFEFVRVLSFFSHFFFIKLSKRGGRGGSESESENKRERERVLFLSWMELGVQEKREMGEILFQNQLHREGLIMRPLDLK